MADVSGLIESKNLNGEELGPRMHQATITEAVIEQFDNGPKVCVKFAEFPKRLVANVTQTKTLANLFGKDTTGWVGNQIQMFGEQLSSGKFAGKWTIKILQAQPPAPQQPQAGNGALTEDEIPF